MGPLFILLYVESCCSLRSKAFFHTLSNHVQNGISEIIVKLTVSRKISLQLPKLFRLQINPALF